MTSLIRHPRLILRALRHPRTFARGFAEGRGDVGMTYDDDPTSPRSEAYDAGRDLRRLGGE